MSERFLTAETVATHVWCPFRVKRYFHFFRFPAQPFRDLSELCLDECSVLFSCERMRASKLPGLPMREISRAYPKVATVVAPFTHFRVSCISSSFAWPLFAVKGRQKVVSLAITFLK